MKELAKALAAARAKSKSLVFKGSRNQSQGYAYAGHEAVIRSGIREIMADHGLALVQTGVQFMGAEPFKTKAGEQLCWRWRGDFVLLHDSGDSLALFFEATTVTNDKAAFVASTALDRTAHMRVMEMAGSSDEDPEHEDEPEPRRGGPTVEDADVLAAMAHDLGTRTERAALVQWARDLASLQTRGDKRAAWAAFGARCKQLGMDPTDVAGEARGRAA